MKPLQITITSPCSENWNEMTVAEKGRFCAVCQKTVIDFTKSTDKQIAETFATTPQLCGRFLTTQLDRDLVIQSERKSFWLASLFFGCISLSNFKAQAQGEPRKTVITETTNRDHLKVTGDTIVAPKIVTGIVSNGDGPLSGVVIKIKGTEAFTTTDFEGKYTINVKEGDVLVYSFMGMKEIKKTVGTSNVINTVMFESEELIKMVYQVGGALGKRRSFMGRVFHRIGNWFR